MTTTTCVRLLPAWAALCAISALASASHAAIINDSQPFSIAPIGATGGNPQTVSLAKFDSNLGTLLSVTIGYDGSGTGSFSFVSSVNPGDTADATLNSTLKATFPNSGFGFDVGISGPHTGLTVGNTVDVGGGNFGDPPFIVHTGMATALPHTPYVAAGGGSFNVSVQSLGGWTFIVQGSGNQNTVTVSFDSQVDGDVWVEYLYVPVPEPGSTVLLGLGGVTLVGWNARKRTAKNSR